MCDEFGVDYWCTYLSFLMRVLIISDPGAEGRDARAWLPLLAEEGRDVRKYLEREYEAYATRGLKLESWEYLPCRLKFHMGESPNISCEFAIDPQSGAGLVRVEYRLMNLIIVIINGRHFISKRASMHGPSFIRYRPGSTSLMTVKGSVISIGRTG